jgi:hypothetical protein
LVPGPIFHGRRTKGIVVEMIDGSKLAGMIIVLDSRPLAQSGLFRNHGGATKCCCNGSDLRVSTSSGCVSWKSVEDISNTYNADIAAITKSKDGDRGRPSDFLGRYRNNLPRFSIISLRTIRVTETPGSGFMIANKMR